MHTGYLYPVSLTCSHSASAPRIFSMYIQNFCSQHPRYVHKGLCSNHSGCGQRVSILSVCTQGRSLFPASLAYGHKVSVPITFSVCTESISWILSIWTHTVSIPSQNPQLMHTGSLFLASLVGAHILCFQNQWCVNTGFLFPASSICIQGLSSQQTPRVILGSLFPSFLVCGHRIPILSILGLCIQGLYSQHPQ